MTKRKLVRNINQVAFDKMLENQSMNLHTIGKSYLERDLGEEVILKEVIRVKTEDAEYDRFTGRVAYMSLDDIFPDFNRFPVKSVLFLELKRLDVIPANEVGWIESPFKRPTDADRS